MEPGNHFYSMSNLELVNADGNYLEDSHHISYAVAGTTIPYYFLLPPESSSVLQMEGDILKTVWEDHNFQAYRTYFQNGDEWCIEKFVMTYIIHIRVGWSLICQMNLVIFIL